MQLYSIESSVLKVEEQFKQNLSNSKFKIHIRTFYDKRYSNILTGPMRGCLWGHVPFGFHSLKYIRIVSTFIY